jgi:hypothetical protein
MAIQCHIDIQPQGRAGRAAARRIVVFNDGVHGMLSFSGMHRPSTLRLAHEVRNPAKHATLLACTTTKHRK